MNWQYDDEIRIWMREHDGRRVTEYDVAGIFSKAYAKAATVKNAISGFEKCGIHPFRKDMFSDEDFLGAYFTDNPLCSETTGKNNVSEIVTFGSASQENATSSHSCVTAGQLPERMHESPGLSTSIVLLQVSCLNVCTNHQVCQPPWNQRRLSPPMVTRLASF